MNPIRQNIFLCFLSFLIIGVNSAYSEILITPHGMAASVEPNEEVVRELSLSNQSEEDIHFNISLNNPPEGQFVGPRRDDLGDEIVQYETGQQGWMGLAWDGEVMWGIQENSLRAFDPNQEEFVEDININRQFIGMAYDGESFWFGEIGDGNQALITNLDREGNILVSHQVEGFIVTGITCEGQDIWYYSLDFEGGQMLLNKMTQEGEEIVEYNIGNIIQDMFIGLSWVPEHRDGNLWILGISEGTLFQVDVGEEEMNVIQEGNLGRQETFGFEHDGENLWFSSNEAVWYVIDDGVVEEPPWIALDPREGDIAANDDVLLEVTFSPGELENGLYELLAVVEYYEVGNEDDIFTQSISILMSIGLDIASLVGRVIDEETEDPIVNAVISLERYEIGRISDEQGEFTIRDLPWGEYQLTCTALDYLPYTEQIVIDQDGDFIQNIELLHAECEPDIEEIAIELETGDSEEINFTVSNRGNGDLSYFTELRIRGEANADPWELRDRIMVSQIVDDTRIQGVVFINEMFYIAGSNSRDPQIYILNRNGELIDQFNQMGVNETYGYKDLAFDGELIWGGYRENIYGFTPDGELVHQIESPINTSNNLAWDSDRGVLWTSSTTSDIIGIDLEGNQIAVVDRTDLRIYGLSYWSDDPNECPLYVYHRDRDIAEQIVSKKNPENDENVLVEILDPNGNGSGSGSFITNQYDLYSWVFITIVNDAGEDRLEVWQLDSRTDWMDIDRIEGIIEANQAEEFTLTLSAEGLPADVYEGQIVFTHNGIGGETSIPIRLTVLEEVIFDERVLVLDAGWNLVSLNIELENNDIIEMTQNLVDNETLTMVKDGSGRFYTPAFNFNNIPGWEVSEGYLIKMFEIDDLICHGIAIEFDRPIPLRRGWQLVSYYPRQPVAVRTALSGIVEYLILAKDGDGRFYSPQWDFCNIGELSEGLGYQLNVTQDVDLIYVIEENNALNQVEKEDGYFPKTEYSVFPIHKITPENMSLLIIGDETIYGEIGVFADDMLVGSGIMQNGRSGIAVWGDDPTTNEIDGALTNAQFNLVFANEGEKKNIEFEQIKGSGKYNTDDFQVVELHDFKSLPSEFGLNSAYPNPFNNITNIRFNLHETNIINLELFDLSGRKVSEFFKGIKTAGQHSISINGSPLSSGVYVLQLSSDRNISKKKLVLLK